MSSGKKERHNGWKKCTRPKLGLTKEEGIINKWRVKEGDRCNKGDVLEVANTKLIWKQNLLY